MMTDHQNTPPSPALHARRCWIYQPSVEDAGHQYHGSNVLALPSGPDTYEAYFLSGDTMSRTVPACWLREGWEVAPPAPGAALQQVVVPDGYVLMPVQLTAENGAKGALMGEFTVTREMHCSVCDYDDTDETCEVCGGEVEYVEHVSVPWDSIKEIYNAAVKVCGKQVTYAGESRLSQPAAGFALVPVEPTIDMLIAGQEEWAQGRRGALEDCEEAAAIYRAMIAALPGAPDDDQQALPGVTKAAGSK